MADTEKAARDKLAHVIAIGIKPEKGEKSEKSEEKKEGPDPAKLAAMEDLLAAFEKKDPAALLEAWESAQTLCS
jgi:hypothetical protein